VDDEKYAPIGKNTNEDMVEYILSKSEQIRLKLDDINDKNVE